MPSFRFLTLAFCLTCSTAFCQQTEIQIGPAYNGLEWAEFVSQLEQDHPVRIFFREADTQNFRPPQLSEAVPLLDFLQAQLPNCTFTFDQLGHLFISGGEPIITQLSPDIYPRIRDAGNNKNTAPEEDRELANTSNQHIGKVIAIGDARKGAGKRNAIFEGTVVSAADGLTLPGATILFEELGTGVATDENGGYSIELKKGTYTLIINHLNHQEQKLKINLLSDGGYAFKLDSKTTLLKEVTITSTKFDRVQSTKMGFERLTIKSVEAIPLVLGEKDILKVASLLAGVQSVGEGTAGFNVRGSPADQNLFYIDRVPIYNTSHLLGFFSAFNSDAISEFSISKSNIPAKFGGRLASIFEITALEGDKNKYKARGGISPVTGNLLFEGPNQKDKSSIIFLARNKFRNTLRIFFIESFL